jgi:threonine/homoserine/homoserine lactone efflux protein
MTEADWINLIVLCLAGALSPGISWLMILSMTATRGLGVGIAGALGHGLGITCFALATVFGLSALLMAAPAASGVLTWLGLALLVYFGWTLVRRGTTPLPERLSTQGGFVAGFFIAIVNPKVLIFFLAIFGPFVDPNHRLLDQVVMGALAGFIDAVVYTGVALFAGSAKALLTETSLPTINRTLGILLIGSAVWLAFSAI